MKKIVVQSVLLLFFAVIIMNFTVTAQNDQDWTKKKAEKWLKSNKWANGLKLKVHKSADIVEFAKQYHKNKDRWDKAFAYLKNTDLDKVAPGKYPIDGDVVFASVTEGPTKAFESTKWEAHKKYVDIQYIIKGKEKMGIAPFSKAVVTEEFNETKDVGFYKVPEADGKYHVAQPGTFLLFFPADAHRPSIKIEGCDSDKKVVVKIKVD